ncbi:hypothetical protein DQK91_02775 [Oceanidesulfovibrio marinus]|uniref:Major tropism determinant N-terminal domain-containing protein n=2 Tax=Oceanidesulfovibrio marinus TaxID=370038 RepID=A0A6P1ZMD9_9BACT|nr:hypothetical protein DQK91_02775 [Oceanidesulfovibrio marinus]
MMEAGPVADTIQIRRDTAGNWSVVDPVLASGEIGHETDTRKSKIGDGVTPWNQLSYWVNPSGSGDGLGDMLASIYDIDSDGVVDAAETVPRARRPTTSTSTGAKRARSRCLDRTMWTGWPSPRA